MILGETVSRSTAMDQGLAEELVSCQTDETFSTVLGGTMCTDDFYEGVFWGGIKGRVGCGRG